MATYNDIKKIKIGDNTFVFHVPTASEVGALPSSTTIPAITLNGSGSTSPSFYAPTTVGTSGYVLKSNGSGAPTWTSATLTDTKVTTAALTSGTLYYPILATGTGTATRQIDSTIKGLTYKSTAGTTSTVGKAELTLGNSTASGTANNEQGQLILYGSTAYKHTIEGAPTANQTITLPNASGTIALTSDLSSYLSHAEVNNLVYASGGGIGVGESGTIDNNGTCGISIGDECDADGNYSMAIGEKTRAAGRSQLVIGVSNVVDTEDDEGGNGYKKHAFIIGNGGKNGSTYSNAFSIDWNGDIYTENSSTPLGQYLADYKSTRTTAANIGTYATTGPSVTLTPGTWILFGHWSWASNSSSTARQCAVRLYNVTEGSVLHTNYACYGSQYAASVEIIWMHQFDSNAKIRLEASSSVAGSSTNQNQFIRAVKVHS